MNGTHLSFKEYLTPLEYKVEEITCLTPIRLSPLSLMKHAWRQDPNKAAFGVIHDRVQLWCGGGKIRMRYSSNGTGLRFSQYPAQRGHI